ncbi:MAG: class I SAM-dependent methyltransferase [Lentimicrobium sp.]|uniref:class I SAM-dependent methyltransferase n=1 Tax=Lentimicrobium sp. TaxID=2034841 RepID=UPI0025FD5D48|nr:class I SAM-dependent methyltransferase [Lentimicrobium sp.]MCO5255513.1 class I SAM-dependent methyltransferase [Lentimicrobium sp.]MCO5261789.1 class I SAM-dependent methyltransferase [Lentimicrobium sp.]
MKNPWLQIPFQDYENHMRDVGQAQVLRRLLGDCLRLYSPGSFALIGCATGNGLEEVDPAVTGVIHAVDINPAYLEQLNQRFVQILPGLSIHCLDLEIDPLTFSNADLIFCGLVLEYVKPEVLIPKLLQALSADGTFVIVIQQTRNAAFVSKTKYRSLDLLSSYAGMVSGVDLYALLRELGVEVRMQYDVSLNDSKSFRVFHCCRSRISS